MSDPFSPSSASPTPESAPKVIDLMEALKASLRKRACTCGAVAAGLDNECACASPETPARATLADAIRAHIAERTHGDCDSDNPQWDGGFKAACSQILAVVDGLTPDGSAPSGEPPTPPVPAPPPSDRWGEIAAAARVISDEAVALIELVREARIGQSRAILLTSAIAQIANVARGSAAASSPRAGDPDGARLDAVRADAEEVREFLAAHCTARHDCPAPHGALDRIIAAAPAASPETPRMQMRVDSDEADAVTNAIIDGEVPSGPEEAEAPADATTHTHAYDSTGHCEACGTPRCPICGRSKANHDGRELHGCILFCDVREPLESWHPRNEQAKAARRATPSRDTAPET